MKKCLAWCLELIVIFLTVVFLFEGVFVFCAKTFTDTPESSLELVSDNLAFLAKRVYAEMLICGTSGGGGGVTHLLEEDGEGHADGTNMTAAGWTADGADPGDLCEIDTAQHNTGSGSVLVDNDGAVADGYVYKDFTEQSSGTFYVDFYIRAAAVSGSNVSLLVSDADGYNTTNDSAKIGRAHV